MAASFAADGGHTVEHLVKVESAEANLSYRDQILEDERDPGFARKLIGGFRLSSL